MKRFAAILLALTMMLSITVYAEPPSAAAASSSVSAGSAYESQYISLRGDWNFTVYRKYSNMYQYLPYNMCDITWENKADATVPNAAVYSQWEVVQGPADDYSTGGLLQMVRGDTSQITERDKLSPTDLFPKWSEAWFCKTVELPAGFLKEDTVTLLLGVIDDMDVVYINGVPVAQSGFIDASGTKADPSKVPADGGFAQQGDFRFEKSYWEVSREYSVPASLFHEGANEIAIRIYNNNSFGGFYDRTMALVSNHKCVNYLKDLPIEPLENSAGFEALISAQTAAIEAKDITAYASTLASTYHENELDKAEQIAAMQSLFDTYDTLTVTDENSGFYRYQDRPVYFASRTLIGVKDGMESVISKTPEFIAYLTMTARGALEQGNLSHCYSVKYTSHLKEMNGKKLQYSIYLPPSYYSHPEKSYPVVYLLHGINSTGDSFVNVDHIETKMNEWIRSGSIEEMIVVMPNSGKSSFYQDTDASNGITDSSGPWAKHIYLDMVEEIDSHYRTLAQPEFRGISGISMGGSGVCTVGMSHPDIFTSYATHMGAIPEDISQYMTATGRDLAKLDFYMDCGLQDQMVNPERTKNAAEYLERIGANITWELRDGGHNSAFYMEGMPLSMKMHSDHFVKNGLSRQLPSAKGLWEKIQNSFSF